MISPEIRVDSGGGDIVDRSRTILIRPPYGADGADVHDLVAACPPLDQNSLYANLLQCSHFSKTCALARLDDSIVGWMSGYVLPDEPDVYFLWQVAVRETARGEGLPKRLIADILKRPACAGIRHLKTTITPNNAASWGLFQSVANWLDAPLREQPFFERDAHFKGRHETEMLVTIGPFETPPPLL